MRRTDVLPVLHADLPLVPQISLVPHLLNGWVGGWEGKEGVGGERVEGHEGPACSRQNMAGCCSLVNQGPAGGAPDHTQLPTSTTPIPLARTSITTISLLACSLNSCLMI